MKIVIIGAGGHGRVVLDILRNNHQFEVAGFIDTNQALHRQSIDGIEVLGNLSLIQKLQEMGIGGAFVAIGDNRVRQKYAAFLAQAGVSLVSAIHPGASVAGTAQIGKNVVIAAGANICTHVTIEDSAILNTGCIIDHESVIHRAAHICPGVKLAGHVRVMESAFIGIGATIIQGITIGESAVVGAGTVVLQEVPAFTTVVGVPARIVKPSHITGITTKRVNLQPSTADLEPARSIIKRPQRRKPLPIPTAVEV
ncbi:MAG: acetyltransferase [Sedimentisphaerales bacterium]|nr:acetyltransferase [Sedimentisphaerales bacterium]